MPSPIMITAISNETCYLDNLSYLPFIMRSLFKEIIYVKDMPSVINKPFLRQNLAYRLDAETKIHPFIKKRFSETLKRAKDSYSNFDFLGDNIVLELKTRKGDYIKNRYATFPFDKPKLDRWKTLKKNNPDLVGYVCWWWPDMNVFHYWKIHDDDDIVDHFLKEWRVDGKDKWVVEVFREDTQKISLSSNQM